VGWCCGGWNDGFDLNNEASTQNSSRERVIHVFQLSD
jgi:hypothetical protein